MEERTERKLLFRFKRGLVLALPFFFISQVGLPDSETPLNPVAQAVSKQNASEPELLTTRLAIRKALEANRDLRAAKNALGIAELDFQDAWASMFLPQVNFDYTLGSAAYTVGQLNTPSGRAAGRAGFNGGYPASNTFTLSVGKYKLFNKWDDWKAYEKAKLALARAKDVYVDAERELRFSVSLKLFEVRILQEMGDISKRSVDVSEAILGNVKSRQGLGQSSENEVASSASDSLEARKTLIEKQVALKRAVWELNVLLGDSIGTPYRIAPSAVRFTSIGITAEESFRVYLENSTEVRDFKNQIRNAELDVEAALKASLPLPEVTFSGVQVSWAATPGSTLASSGFTSTPNNPNLEVSAALTLTLPLVGPNGFLNGRERERKRLALESRQLGYVQGVAQAQVEISNSIEVIRQQEFNIDASRKQFQQAAKILEEFTGKLSSASVARLELRDAVRQAREAELALYTAQVNHLTQKRDLARKIGLSAFPGDPVE